MSKREIVDPDVAKSVARRTINALAGASGVLSASAIVLMTGGIAFDVVVRAVNGQGLVGVIESVDPLLVIVAFFGLSVTEMKGEHVALSLVTDRLRPFLRYVVVAVGVGLTLLFVVWLMLAGFDEAIRSVAIGETRTGIVRIPLWPARVAVVIGLLLLLLQLALTFLDAVRSAKARQAVGVWKTREGQDALD